MNGSLIRRGAAISMLFAALCALALLSLAGAAAGGSKVVELERAEGQAAGLKLCFFWNGEEARGCQLHGAANAPTAVVHRLRATWNWRQGDTVRIFRIMDDPDNPRRHIRTELAACNRSPCFADAARPRAGLVGADYVAVLFRGNLTPRPRSNVIRFAWLTPNCRLAGNWAQVTETVGSSMWTISANGTAKENGLGRATGTATLTGTRLRIEWKTGVWRGFYVWQLHPGCSGTGILRFTAGPRAGQTFKSTVQRTA